MSTLNFLLAWGAIPVLQAPHMRGEVAHPDRATRRLCVGSVTLWICDEQSVGQVNATEGQL